MDLEKRRFVILEHRLDDVHWDFMVEDGEGLRTWAIDKAIIANQELPARALPVHRKVYLDYEGEISGGRGFVLRWDSGTCQVREWGGDRVSLVVVGDQIAGLVELRCLGDVEARRWLFRLGKLS